VLDPAGGARVAPPMMAPSVMTRRASAERGPDWRCDRSGLIDLEPFIDSSCDQLQVTGVRAYDQIAAAHGSLDYACINDVGNARPRRQGTDRAGLPVIESLDITAGQQPGKLNLPGRSTPGLRDDRRRNRRNQAASK
jgi:hypothetical protein